MSEATCTFQSLTSAKALLGEEYDCEGNRYVYADCECVQVLFWWGVQ